MRDTVSPIYGFGVTGFEFWAQGHPRCIFALFILIKTDLNTQSEFWRDCNFGSYSRVLCTVQKQIICTYYTVQTVSGSSQFRIIADSTDQIKYDRAVSPYIPMYSCKYNQKIMFFFVVNIQSEHKNIIKVRIHSPVISSLQ